MNTPVKNPETVNQVISFIADTLSLEEGDIRLDSRLRQDLGLNGDTVDEFFSDFSYAFVVKTDNFRINDYFGPGTGIHPFFSSVLWLFGNSKPLKTLTVGDLVRAIEKGWLA